MARNASSAARRSRSPFPPPHRAIASRTRRRGGKRCWPRWTACGRSTRPNSGRSRASGCPGRCTVPCCWTRRVRCCGPASCGTTCVPSRSAENWKRRSRHSGKSPATRRCRASPRPSCFGCAGTNRRCSPATRTVLLPKAWVRFRLTGELIDEMSDASGTLWLDVGKPRLVRRRAPSHRPVARVDAPARGRQRAGRPAAPGARGALGHEHAAYAGRRGR